VGVQHYDVFAPVDDLVTGGFHRAHRAAAVEQLRLEPGNTVLDAPCGTGASLPLVAARTGPMGRCIGVDFSPGMLRQARRRVARKQLGHVTLVRGDAFEIDHEMLGVERVDAVLCMLGLTVIPEWERVVDRPSTSSRPAVATW
jgi:demethylmenaquinone methyltransferase/2-methoxy-6-polyprenyl-1,4-benzoquinol methylase